MNAEQKLYVTMGLATVAVTTLLVGLNYLVNHALALPF